MRELQAARLTPDHMSRGLDANPSSHATIEAKAVRLPGGVAFRWETQSAGVLVLAALGCASIPTSFQSLCSLSELRAYVGDQDVIGYRGIHEGKHFFRTQGGATVSIPKQEWSVAELPVTLGWCIPLVFRDDRLVVPPSEWSSATDLNSLQWTLRE